MKKRRNRFRTGFRPPAEFVRLDHMDLSGAFRVVVSYGPEDENFMEIKEWVRTHCSGPWTFEPPGFFAKTIDLYFSNEVDAMHARLRFG